VLILSRSVDFVSSDVFLSGYFVYRKRLPGRTRLLSR
jgi:hypothetical protein